MTFADLANSTMAMARPGGSKSSLVQNNLLLWTNEFVLRPFYKLRRWWFLNQTQTASLWNGVSTYTFQGGATALFVTEAAYGTLPLLLPPLVQAQAFWPGTGSPDALALLPKFGSLTNASPVTQFQVFPTPNAAYQIAVSFTQPFNNLELPTDHNFVTDEYPLMVQAGMMTVAFLAMHEDQLFAEWLGIYKQQVRAVATYDHEVRRGGTMMEPMEPFVPDYSTIMPTPAGAAAGAQ